MEKLVKLHYRHLLASTQQCRIYSMESHELKVGKAFFEEMVRKAARTPGEVVMVVRRPGDRVLVNTKGFYPPETYRLPTGMMKPDETPVQAFGREIREETGLDPGTGLELGIIENVFIHGRETVRYSSHIFLTEETRDEPVPEDEEEEIAGFREIPVCELREIAGQLRRLPEPWQDWGRFRAVAHDFVCRYLCCSEAD